MDIDDAEMMEDVDGSEDDDIDDSDEVKALKVSRIVYSLLGHY